MGLTLGKLVILLIVGSIAGSLAGRLVTLSRQGFGRWINLLVGMLGALVGNFLFYLFRIDFGLGELNISVQDLISAFLGSLLCVLLWWLIRKRYFKRKTDSPPT